MESKEGSESILDEPIADQKDPNKAEVMMPAADKVALTQLAMTDLKAAQVPRW